MRDYVIGQDRNEPLAVAHYYDGNFADPGKPLCARGWNRAGGFGYSIFRGVASAGLCKVCERRALADKAGVKPRYRKTKWI